MYPPAEKHSEERRRPAYRPWLKSQPLWLRPELLSFADPELHHDVIVSPLDSGDLFKAALFVESNGSRIVTMHHQHEPFRLPGFCLTPNASEFLRFGDQVPDDLP